MLKNEMRWKDWVWLCLAASMGLGAILAIVPGYGKIGVWLSSDAAPAWVQAVGSILAIIAAANIAAWQAKRARADALEQKRVAAREKMYVIKNVINNYGAMLAIFPTAVGGTNAWLTAVDHAERVRKTLNALPAFEIPGVTMIEHMGWLDIGLSSFILLGKDCLESKNTSPLGNDLFQKYKTFHIEALAAWNEEIELYGTTVGAVMLKVDGGVVRQTTK